MKRWPKKVTIVLTQSQGRTTAHVYHKDDADLWEPKDRRIYALVETPKKRKRRKEPP